MVACHRGQASQAAGPQVVGHGWRWANSSHALGGHSVFRNIWRVASTGAEGQEVFRISAGDLQHSWRSLYTLRHFSCYLPWNDLLVYVACRPPRKKLIWLSMVNHFCSGCMGLALHGRKRKWPRCQLVCQMVDHGQPAGDPL